MGVKPLSTDLSVLHELGFSKPPVGVRFCFFKPEGIEPLDTPLAMCEMVSEAQRRHAPFYMDRDNEDCMGKGAMGMMEGGEPGWAAAGLIGERMDVFKDAGANMRCMRHYTTFKDGAVNYVAFASLDALDFEPDLLIFVGPMREVGLILRAMAWSTGELLESKSTPVFQCSWIYSYPQLTGKVNYVTLGAGFGTTAREAFEPGQVVVSVPSPWFPVILQNLKDMRREPRAWGYGREEWIEEEKGIYAKLAQDAAEAGF